MPNPDTSNLYSESGWKMVAEFLVPDMPGAERQVLEQVDIILQTIGLEAGQVRRANALISEGLRSVESSYKSLHLHISALGVNYPSTSGPSKGDRPEDQAIDSGLGFFVIKRIIDQVGDPDQGSYRMVEVLIYRE